jgi:hypothetical protein
MSATTNVPARADGSATADRRESVEIDLGDDADRWRYRCPEGHANWAPTNNHLWCRQCRRNHEAGADVDPEHYALLDTQTGEEIPWSAIEVV